MTDIIQIVKTAFAYCLCGVLTGDAFSSQIPGACGVRGPAGLVWTYNDTSAPVWSSDFELVELESRVDKRIQLMYFYRSPLDRPRPLLVSLHTWSGNYAQEDPLSALSKANGFHYVHPDFRGPNVTAEACCSDLVINDIDEAIDYAIKNANVDTSKIFIAGVSGGGYATLCMYMKSRHRIRQYSSWVPISDLIAWYRDSGIAHHRYSPDIVACTSSENGRLNEDKAKLRSPLYWKTTHNRGASMLKIYAGVYDGFSGGSVPITQSIDFYNKLLKDLGVEDRLLYVTRKERNRLLRRRRPVGSFGKISDREICLLKSYQNIQLTIFVGGHEMLPGVVVEEMKK